MFSVKDLELEIWQRQALMALADQSSPWECCGFVMDNGVIIPIQNIEDELAIYRMHPGEQIQAMAYRMPWAVYHSHVSSRGYPSQTDKAMQRSDYHQIIVSLMEHSVRLFDPEWRIIKEWGSIS